MIGTLPGTTLEADLSRPDGAGRLLDPIFMAGGLMLSQVSALTALEPHTIQNWVRRGFVSAPEHKRYTQRQFCRIAIINMLRDCLKLDDITGLLSYLNGHLDDESDDLIDDALLYRYITRLTSRAASAPMAGRKEWADWCGEVLADFQEPIPGAKERVAQVLQVILTAYTAARLRSDAERMLRRLKGDELL